MTTNSKTPSRQRILVVGTSGSGKSTLATKIAKIFELPHTELDSIYHGPNWEPLSKNVFRERVSALVSSSDGWVIDGNYSAVQDILIKEATTLVWLDFNLALVLWRLTTRTLRRMVTREVLWNGNRENYKSFFQKDNIILWALSSHPRNKQRYSAYAADPSLHHLEVLRFCSPSEVEQWLNQIRVQ